MRESRNSSLVEGRKARLGRSLEKQNSGARSQESEWQPRVPASWSRTQSPRGDPLIEGEAWLDIIRAEVQVSFLVLEWLPLAVFQALGWRRQTDLLAGPALDFLGCAKRFRLSWFGRAHPASLAEVCRNRTDRSRIAGSAGFEAPDGHQPACTSGLILDEGGFGVNLRRPKRRKASCCLPTTRPSGKTALLRQGKAERHAPVAVVGGVSFRATVGLQMSLTDVDSGAGARF